MNERSIPETSERVRRRAEARRLEILRAAARAFRKRGFAETGMRDIAAEADVAPGSLYHYFRGKQEILFFCQDRSLDRMLATLEETRLAGAAQAEQLRRVIVAHVRCLLDELDGAAAHLEVEALPDELRRPIIDKRDRYERGLRRLVAAGIEAGEFTCSDAGLVTRAILGAANWTARWFRPEGARSAGALADSLADYLVRGLLADPAGDLARRAAARSGGTP